MMVFYILLLIFFVRDIVIKIIIARTRRRRKMIRKEGDHIALQLRMMCAVYYNSGQNTVLYINYR